MIKEIFLVALAATFIISAIFFRLMGSQSFMNEMPERMLGIPFNIHHDLLGIIFMAISIPMMIYASPFLGIILMGFGGGIFMEHLVFEGLRLVTPLNPFNLV